MAGQTRIEWTDCSWNPTVGCTVCAAGCTNCYAMRMAARLEAMGVPHYAGTTRKVKGKAVWTGKIALAPEDILTQPLRWKKPRRIFVNSMSDLFHEDMPDEWIDKMFAVMALCPQHTFQVLTKRPGRMRTWYSATRPSNLPDNIIERRDDVAVAAFDIGQPEGAAEYKFTEEQCMIQPNRWPLPNVWLGTSVSTQADADANIPDLLATPAAVRFVSYEPALGQVSFRWAKWQPFNKHGTTNHLDGLRRLDWIICGGESGPGARPMHPDWARSVRDQCKASGVPFFMKQMAKKAPIPDDLMIREWPGGASPQRTSTGEDHERD